MSYEQMSSPEQDGELEVSVLLLVYDGLRLVTFKDSDTFARTFDEPWNYMDYVWQHPAERENPIAYFGYQDLARKLAQAGFREMHSAEPIGRDRELYLEYCHARLEADGDSIGGGDER